MRNTVIWSFLSLAALATGGLVTGCDSDAKLARSALGDSCDTTSDCNDDLRCIDHTCYNKKGTTSSGGSSTSEGGDGTGATVTGPKPPVLGGEGETCTKRADCEDGLACLSQRCQKDASSGEGGAGPVGGPTLGGPGETCGLTSDCATGLACLPSDGFNNFPEAKAIGSNSIGVCTPTDSGLEPTGKSCNGAECTIADDCCELPVATHIANALAPTYGTGVNSCAELEVVLDGVNCGAAVLTTANAARCFAKTAYCTCGKTTWTCSDAGRCVYGATCTKDYATPEGCPTYSRAGYALTSLCDTEGSGKCEPPAALATCKKDVDCDKGLIVADAGGVERCTAGECTCYTGACYRKCGEDLDCAKGKTCDTKTKVCVAAAACESDAFCATYNNDIHSKCLMPEGVCDTQCDNDRQCNYGNLTYGPNTRVCNAMHRCELVGCTSDSECPAAAGGVKLFCTETPAPVAGGTASSAITD